METGTSRYDDEMEIDLLEIFYLLLSKIKIIIATTILGAVLALGGTWLFVTPMYSASSMIYVLTQTTSITSLADLKLGSQLALDFQILATSRPVVETVIDKLKLDTTYEQLVKTISVKNLDKSRILKITVENTNPVMSADISNALADALSKRVAEIMVTDKPTKVENAVVPSHPISPSKTKNTMLGAFIGAILVCGILVVRHLMDDTIKNAQDVEKYLKLNTLAQIPINPDEETLSKKRKPKRKNKN